VRLFEIVKLPGLLSFKLLKVT